MSDGFILSVMGESEIETFEVQLKNKRMSSQVHNTIEDQLNWLGSILDVGADTNLTQAHKENIAYIAESFVLDNLKSDFKSYVLLLVLREKWPVGQKSKFKIRADKVGSNHTYITHICEPQVIGPSPDEKDLKRLKIVLLHHSFHFLRKIKNGLQILVPFTNLFVKIDKFENYVERF